MGIDLALVNRRVEAHTREDWQAFRDSLLSRISDETLRRVDEDVVNEYTLGNNNAGEIEGPVGELACFY
ncbi:hypothetical protein PAXRUDRAFT_822812 [Paxillus rubicundulus Ve08.2h10]|uniref:Uncharacterized protein n=1 Tax=Paxillus rubicundulus Ve08.2h10 TaxID=930991 RepID=A0A0D0E4Q5_9AGAM|nr:hypothetical protein PAXRUDRAFT_822812 [Paxillus rubicundulus Ve08.2h10]